MSVSGSNIIDRVAKFARMDSSVSGTDRALILGWLQEAAERVCVDASIRTPAEASATLTAGTAAYSLNSSPFPTDMANIHSLRVSSAASAKPLLERKTWDEITELAAANGGSSSDPLYFGVAYPRIVFVPTPSTAVVVTVNYAQTAPTMADSGTAITFIPDAYLWMTLFPLCMYNAETHKKQPDADTWLAKYQEGIVALKLWGDEVGGDVAPDWLPAGSGFAVYPDVYP